MACSYNHFKLFITGRIRMDGWMDGWKICPYKDDEFTTLMKYI